MLAPSVVAAYLGYWQTERYFWKVDLLQRREKGLKEDAVQLSEVAHQLAEHARLKVTGKYRHEKSVFVGPRPKTVNGSPTAGFVLITPLITEQFDRPVLVNRGWVPAQWRSDASLRAANSPSEASPFIIHKNDLSIEHNQKQEYSFEVELEGFVRVSEPRSMFVPDNRPWEGDWYWIDVAAIAQQCGLPPETPLIELFSDAPSETRSNIPNSMEVLAFKGKYGPQKTLYPLQKPFAELMDVSVKPVDHRNYALIWFSLSASTAALGLRAIKRR